MRSTSLLALVASVTTASAAAHQGFNYGASNSDGTHKFEKDFEAEFTVAKNLVGTSGFSSARLYTMIQGGSSTNEPIQAIKAAITTKTSLLLGLWASGGQGPFDAEITALKSAIATYGTEFTDLVVGISVGSEDLYRASPMGIEAKSGYGAEATTLASYIATVRKTIAGTGLAKAPIGHVDTWTAWVNETNKAVAEACDWVGVDAYPYFQSTMSNSIDSGKSLFEAAVAQTQSVVGSGKEIWITETGWPVSGKTQNLGVASPANAKKFWDDVGCPRFGKTNIWWYTLYDDDSTTPNPSFGIVGPKLSTTPNFDLSCSNITTSTSSASATSSGSASATGGLSPVKGGSSNGSAVATGGSASATGGSSSGSSGSGSSGSSGSGNNYTSAVAGSPSTPTGSSSGSATSATVGSGAAMMMQASFVAVVGAAFAAIVAL